MPESSPTCSVPASLTHAIIVVGQLKAREAETVVGAHCVLACAVPAGLAVALIDVCEDANWGQGRVMGRNL